MEAHAKKYSQGYNKDLKDGTAFTFWAKDFDSMAFKTMLRQIISKWGIMSIEMQTAMDADMAVIREDNTFDYVDNEPEVVADVPAQAVQESEPVKRGRPKKEDQVQSEVPQAVPVDAQAALFGNMEG